jgi:hypothetical protein
LLAVASAHEFKLDTVEMPLNVMDHHFNSFEAKVLPVAVKQHIGVLGMKPMGDPTPFRARLSVPSSAFTTP